jgi:hypothetical protein
MAVRQTKLVPDGGWCRNMEMSDLQYNIGYAFRSNDERFERFNTDTVNSDFMKLHTSQK